MEINLTELQIELFEELKVAVAINTPTDGQFVYVNSTFANLVGYTKKEIFNFTYKDITPQEYIARDLEQISVFQKQGELGPYDKEFIRKDGSRVNVRIYSKLMTINNETFIWSSFEDYSEAIEKISQAFQFQKAIQDNAGYAIIATDIDGIITSFNKAAEKMLGYKQQEVINIETPGLFHDPKEVIERSEYFSKILNKEIQPGFETFSCMINADLPNEYDWTYIKKDHSRILVQLSITKLLNSKNETTGYLGIAHDITERRQKELELIKAKQEADNALKAKSEFLANMSHEIRTPMNGILGMSDLLAEKINGSDHSEMIQTISHSANSLLQIINDILDYSKYESGQVEFEETILDLKSLIQELIKLHSSTIKSKKINLITEFSEDKEIFLKGDSVRISQIINNLLNNAIKFTEAGEVRLIVKIQELNNEKALLTLTVQDTGIGIAEKDQIKIFQSFSQADSSTTRRFGGTGLGLTITKKLTELMGGKLSLESIESIGSKFTIKLPLKIASQSEELSIDEREISYDELPLKILIVEDVYINQKVISNLLNKLNYNPFIVNNGKEALQILETEEFDLIFMDCHMPILDGFQATEKIIKVYGEKRPLITALTASAMKEDIERCYASGMDYFISKPVSLKSITKVLLEIFELKRK